MTEMQWAGACYILAAVFALIYWRLQIEDQLAKLDKWQDDEED